MEIKPMLISETREHLTIGIEAVEKKYPDFMIQRKYNGIFAMIHIKEGRIVGIRNRSNNPVLYCYPELESLRFEGVKNAILIAEICVFKGEKDDFYSGILLRSKSRKSPLFCKEMPVRAVLHDIIYFNDNNLVYKPYKDRHNTLKNNFKDNNHIIVVKNYPYLVEAWEEVVRKNYEGLIIKSPSAIYEIGSRTKQQIKIKNYKPAEIIVENYEQNDKGIKVIGTSKIEGKEILAETQFAGVFNIEKGDKLPIYYLDIIKNKEGDYRFIQPHKRKIEQEIKVEI